MKPRQQRRAAYHEAGHVVVRSVVGLMVCPVEIHADGSGLAHGTGLRFIARDELWKMVLVSLAGPIAEARAARCSLFEAWIGGGRTDVAEAKDLIGQMGPVEMWLDHYNNETKKIVREHWPAIDRVAHALLRTPRLGSAEVTCLVAAA